VDFVRGPLFVDLCSWTYSWTFVRGPLFVDLFIRGPLFVDLFIRGPLLCGPLFFFMEAIPLS